MKNKNVTRRRALKIVASGAVVATIALPSKWTRPIVESIVVPAHAQASPTPTTGTTSTVTGTTTATTTTATTTTPTPTTPV
ncbi:hypothetical protein [Mesorhizobium sp. 10J20-29]